MWPIAVPSGSLAKKSRWWPEPAKKLTRTYEVQVEFGIPPTTKFSKFQAAKGQFRYTLFRKTVVMKSKKTGKQLGVIGFIYKA